MPEHLVDQGVVERLRAGIHQVAQTRQVELDMATEDFEWDMSHYEGWPDRLVYRGRSGAQQFLDGWTGAFEDWSMEIESEHEGAEAVCFVLNQSGRPKGGSVPVQMRFAQVWRFRGEGVERVEIWSDVDAAIRSVDPA